MCVQLQHVRAEDKAVLDKIVDSLTSLDNSSNSLGSQDKENNISLKVGEFQKTIMDDKCDAKKVLTLGVGRVCRPAAELLASIGSQPSRQELKSSITADFEEQNYVQVIVASYSYVRIASAATDGTNSESEEEDDDEIDSDELDYDCFLAQRKQEVIAHLLEYKEIHSGMFFKDIVEVRKFINLYALVSKKELVILKSDNNRLI
ncbi:hypothetical protein RND71_001580 [Anisodus tanguticus]|uniref:Uncharacterized protein n=1 Tax=Anisodus tanguticus TaxID=243964 RepID=A0AAE1VR50_9SOLA|nr:hypothetical protein RND71_001580 [Anisodus tanguticus]